ncbi:DAK2 domain protein [Oxobacter pfennigii]|uniref:DAK2 domain protein n=1 Tax=Oxobacter pfennigii TaxID=36849 RepID=A0A0P8WN52_9CLOT|nr:DAK2 domain protein [Oxobacter pfennigii]
MELLNIDGQLLYRMMISGANCLENNKAAVNALNVFPVPDGDTGTNMSMTMTSAVREIQKVKNKTIEEIADSAATGSLMGARGNSGVILSQILRGFAKGTKGKKELNAKNLAAALKEGASTAYKAVMKPTEGTILTVARESADKALELSKNINDINVLMDKVLAHAEAVLNKTPDMLLVLKKAGVVDAGGKGLICIYKGMIDALKGSDIELIDTPEIKEETTAGPFIEEDIEFGYCTEFIIKNTKADVEDLRDKLSSMGDSLIVVGAGDIIKVHVHTNDPGLVLTHALVLGELSKIKIDNMREQHRSILEEGIEDGHGTRDEIAQSEETSSRKKAGVITVAMGEGISSIFTDLGADKVIEGGQTMNPSTEDILNAINAINAGDIYILPNNSNIVLAARQAAELSDKNTIVIPSKSIPQGIAALTVFNPEGDPKDNENEMVSSLEAVKTGQVTYAVRNTSFDDKEITEGDILGLVDGKINIIGKDILQLTESLIASMVTDSDELITIFYGKEVEEDLANELLEKIREKYEDCDVQMYEGGQPLYYFIISVE